jgi:hypothetical protein
MKLGDGELGAGLDTEVSPPFTAYLSALSSMNYWVVQVLDSLLVVFHWTQSRPSSFPEQNGRHRPHCAYVRRQKTPRIGSLEQRRV